MQSLISPERITRNPRSTPEAFSRFMLGGQNPSGSSVMRTASNNIVNFSRGGVRPAGSNIPSMIQNISTNISNVGPAAQSTAVTQNTIQSSVQNINQNVNKSVSNVISNLKTQIQNVTNQIQRQTQATLTNLIQNFTRDYQTRVQTKDDAKPSSILRNFLGLYQNAVDLVTFFGDERNSKRIRNSLKSLNRIFNETFDVAIAIRKTIVRIVRQLSNLPTASGNAPDLNLDVNVPGGRLRQSGGSTLRQFATSRSARAIGFTAAGIGLVAAGAGVASMGQDRARQFQEERLRSTARGEPQQQAVPEGFLDSLSSIIERFSKAVNDLVGNTSRNRQGASSAASSSSSENNPPPGENGANGSPAPGATQLNEGQYREQINEASSISGIPASQIAAMAEIESSFNPTNRSGSNATGLMQIMPGTYRELYSKYGNKYNLNDQVTDPRTSLILGSLYMKEILSGPAQGNLETMVKMYNAGPNSTLSTLNNGEPANHWVKFQRALSKYSRLESQIQTPTQLSQSGITTATSQIRSNNPVTQQSTQQSSIQSQVGVGASTPPQPRTQPTTPPSATGVATPRQGNQSRVGPAPTQRTAEAALNQTPSTANSVQVANLPPNIIVAPTGGADGDQVANVRTPPMTGGESATPDVSGLIYATNPENPQKTIVFNYGILTAFA